MAERSVASARAVAYAVRGLLACALIVVATVVSAIDGPVRSQSMTTPREFGYSIGDEIAFAIHFELASDHRLDMDALPKTGRVTRWLALNAVRVERGHGWSWKPHTVTLVFQVVNTPKGVLGVGTPPQSLRVVGPDDDFPVIVPAWGFTIAPVTARSGRPEGALPQLRPAHPPPLMDTDRIRARALAAALCCVAVAGLLGYMHLWLPFVARTHGPFARACREIARGARRGSADDAYTSALAAAHRAFNATAGRVVFEHELERFFAEHGRFAALREPISDMFQASTTAFFRATGAAPAPSREQVGALLELCKACRDRERGIA